MNPSEHIAQVSAFNCQPKVILQKRYFHPGTGTVFNDIKKRKLEKGVEKLQFSFFSSLP